MLEKKKDKSGQKAYQRNDREDRSLVYRDWLRTVETGGWWLDIDMVKFKNVDGQPTPVAITELTRSDSNTPVGQKYLDAIINRYFGRDKQGQTIEKLGKLLGVPCYLVLFNKAMTWTKVYSFRQKKWRSFSPEEWATYLKKL